MCLNDGPAFNTASGNSRREFGPHRPWPDGSRGHGWTRFGSGSNRRMPICCGRSVLV